MKKAFALFLFFLAVATVYADAPPSVQIRVDVNPKKVYIGDIVSEVITVVYSSSVAPAPLQISTPVGNFDLYAFSTSRPEAVPPDKLKIIHTLILTTFSTGTQTIPEMTLRFLTPDGKMAEAGTEKVTVTVKSLLEEKGDEGNIRPLKPLFTFRSYFWLWITLALLATFGLIVWGWKTRKQRNEVNRSEGPLRPPEEIIWELIHKLESSTLLTEGNSKEFYYQLSVGLRQYLEHRFHFSALDRTTAELLSEFRQNNFSLNLSSLLRDFFDNGDLVKFAKFTPTIEEVTADLERVKQIVTHTTPQKVSEAIASEEKITI